MLRAMLQIFPIRSAISKHHRQGYWVYWRHLCCLEFCGRVDCDILLLFPPVPL